MSTTRCFSHAFASVCQHKFVNKFQYGVQRRIKHAERAAVVAMLVRGVGIDRPHYLDETIVRLSGEIMLVESACSCVSACL